MHCAKLQEAQFVSVVFRSIPVHAHMIYCLVSLICSEITCFFRVVQKK